MADYFAMGGYAFYVWGSYILVALVMGGIFVWSVQELKTRQAALDRLKAQDGGGATDNAGRSAPTDDNEERT